MTMYETSEISGNTNVNKKAYWFIVVVYVIICTILNRGTFEDFSGGVYVFGLFLSLCISIVEMRLAQFIGKSLALKHWKRAVISFLTGHGLVLYLISQQEDFGFGTIILLVFWVGCLFAYGHAVDEEKYRIPRLINLLENKLSKLKGKRVQLKSDHSRAEEQLRIKGEKSVDDNAKLLRKRLNASTIGIEKLTRDKAAELESIENLEREAVAEIRRGYSDFGDAA